MTERKILKVPIAIFRTKPHHQSSIFMYGPISILSILDKVAFQDCGSKVMVTVSNFWKTLQSLLHLHFSIDLYYDIRMSIPWTGLHLSVVHCMSKFKVTVSVFTIQVGLALATSFIDRFWFNYYKYLEWLFWTRRRFIACLFKGQDHSWCLKETLSSPLHFHLMADFDVASHKYVWYYLGKVCI